MEPKSGARADSIEHYLNALTLLERLKDRPRESDLHIALQRVYADKAEYSKAIEHLQQALSIEEIFENKRTERIADIYRELGWTHQLSGQYFSAVNAFETALKLIADIDDYDQTKVAQIHERLGTAYARQNQIQKSLGHYEEEHYIWLSLSKKSKAAESLARMGHIVVRAGHIQQAIDYYKSASALYASAEPPNHIEARDILKISIELCKSSNFDIKKRQTLLKELQDKLSELPNAE